MIRIYTSDKNVPEKKYIFDVVFNEFLGINYEFIITPEEPNYVIQLINKQSITIEDHFWNRVGTDEQSYLDSDFLPDKINYSKNQFTYEDDLPVLYGNPEVKIEGTDIICRIDVFATIFLFLTRWEEYISEDRDFAGRFKYKNSVSAKFNIIHRPVVNEVVEFLWKMLQFCGYNGIRKKHQFDQIISHDIDQPIRLSSLKMLLKAAGKTLIKHKNIPDALNYFVVYPMNKITPKYDLANSFDFLMDVSDSIGTKSYFNFQTAFKSNYDWGYKTDSRFLLKIIQKIKQREHIIGFHPGFYTIDDRILWAAEYQRLCSAAGMKVLHGRQHYLRFNAPYTWQIWEDNGLQTDSTLGYSEMEGFRCGTCYEYSTYNFLTRNKLNLKERPLLLMDVTIMGYQNHTDQNIFYNKFKFIRDIVRKYNGYFVFLWHNSAFDRSIYTRNFYRELIISLT